MAELASVKMELDEESKQLIWEASRLSRSKPGWLEVLFLWLAILVLLFLLRWTVSKVDSLEAKLSDQAEVITNMNNRLIKLEQPK